ncbi:galactose-specific lectin nattectin-like [Halichoeres trimaculatus]|uniref:galactose-specific lectin nattectin-like n=1 Tax=Halichoeres trimaculatus TaxID=147232 RepID=UPI003D9F55FB
MALVFYLVVAFGLWLGADAKCNKKARCCMACPQGWTEYNSRCFKFFYEEKSWDNAENECIKLGGNLASIHTEADLDALLGMIKTSTGKNKQTWVGGHDTVKENCWRWSDGTPFNFTWWGNKEPNNFKDAEHCMELNFSKNPQHPNDWKCKDERSYICGRDMEVKDLQ